MLSSLEVVKQKSCQRVMRREESSSGVLQQPAASLADGQSGCLSCRVVGTTVCSGCAAFLAAQLYRIPAPQGLNRYGTMAFAVGFAGLAVARAMTP